MLSPVFIRKSSELVRSITIKAPVFVFDNFLQASKITSVSISVLISVCKNFNCFKKLPLFVNLLVPIINKNFLISC